MILLSPCHSLRIKSFYFLTTYKLLLIAESQHLDKYHMAHSRKESRHRDGEKPAVNDVARDAPPHARSPFGNANTHYLAGNNMSGADWDAEVGSAKKR